ncbi:MAG: hypothetical protein H7Y60_18245 [Rhodospirillaceae bacterium]|nr:hypothetical protein [Rhodospirillales bacterium]
MYDTAHSALNWLAGLPTWVQGASALVGLLGFIPMLWNGIRLLIQAGKLVIDRLSALNRTTALMRARILCKHLEKTRRCTKYPAITAAYIGRDLFITMFVILYGQIVILDGLRDGNVSNNDLKFFALIALSAMFYCSRVFGFWHDVIYPDGESVDNARIKRLLTRAGLEEIDAISWMKNHGIPTAAPPPPPPTAPDFSGNPA